MKKLSILFVFFFFFLNCTSQNLKVKDISNNEELNYTLSNILGDCINNKSFFNAAFYVKVFQMNDSKATPKNYSEGTDSILDSYLISITPDGDYYTRSKLFKIEGITNPKILEIKEMDYPKFSIKIEYGEYKNRKIKIFEFEGIK